MAPLLTDAAIPEMLTHFEIRSRHVRQNVHDLFDETFAESASQFSDHELLVKALGQLTPESPILLKALSDVGVSSQQLVQLLAIQGRTLESFLPPIVAQFSKEIPVIFNEHRKGVNEYAKQAHLKILSAVTPEAKRTERLKNLRYSVTSFPGNDLPLGDSIVVFRVKGEREFKPFLESTAPLVSVFLPLASDKFFVGESGEEGLSEVDLPLEIARCSSEYFISNTQEGTMKSLREVIGTNAHWFPGGTVTSILEEAIESIDTTSLTGRRG